MKEREKMTFERFCKNIVTMYMIALEGEKLSEKGWKNIAKVNQIYLDMKKDNLVKK